MVALFSAFGILLVSIVGLGFWLERDAPKIVGALATGRLADLPASARNVKVETSGNMFSRQFWLKFEATPEDIEAFIAASPGLKGIAPEYIGSEQPHAPLIANATTNGITKVAEPETRRSREPEDEPIRWIKMGVGKRGRRFEIPWDEQSNYGEVVIDDVTNTVYINTGHS